MKVERKAVLRAADLVGYSAVKMVEQKAVHWVVHWVDKRAVHSVRCLVDN